MTENDLFNRDTLFWRDINYYVPTAFAEVELYEPLVIEGEELLVVNCRLLPFESGVVEYEMEDGGAFTKNEVIRWPFVLVSDLAFYEDENNTQVELNSKINYMPHEQVKSIILRDNKQVVLATKAKI